MGNFLRRLYDWVISWAESPYAMWALFVLALAESSFFPIPPDVLLIALCVGKPKKSLHFATVCLAGSVLGGMLGYGIGFMMWDALDQYFYAYVPGFTPQIFDKVSGLYNQYAGWAVFTAGFTPIPYKVFTIGAGMTEINFGVFVFASILSRGLRFFLVAGAIRIFGGVVREYIEKYFNYFASAFTVLLIGGFLLVKKLLH